MARSPIPRPASPPLTAHPAQPPPFGAAAGSPFGAGLGPVASLAGDAPPAAPAATRWHVLSSMASARNLSRTSLRGSLVGSVKTTFGMASHFTAPFKSASMASSVSPGFMGPGGCCRWNSSQAAFLTA